MTAAACIAGMVLACLLIPACGGDTAPSPVYDSRTAFALAGLEVPPAHRDFLFFDLDPAAGETAAGDLASGLREAASGNEYLVLLGPDAMFNQATLTAALDRQPASELAGATLVYLGPAGHRESVANRLAGRELSLRYVVYP